MTCIVGFVNEGKVYMGGDSAGVGGWDMKIMKHPKVFVKDNMIIGYTSSFRMGQLLQYSLVIPEQIDKSDMEYLCTDFISAVKECFKNNDYSSKKNDVVEGGTFLVGYKGNIYKICDDFQVSLSCDGFDSCGCGDNYALATIFNLKKEVCTKNDESRMLKVGELCNSPYSIIEKSLETAAHFSAGVSGPFYIESI